MKLPEIKKIAENNNIHLTKRINNKSITKNKDELINEICSL